MTYLKGPLPSEPANKEILPLLGDQKPVSDSNSIPGQSWDASPLAPVAQVSRPVSFRLFYLMGAVAIAVFVGGLLVAEKGGEPGGTNARSTNGVELNGTTAIPVNTIRPRKKTLERTLEQAGSIKAWAQAELYAKASGYLKMIQREISPRLAADLVVQSLVGMEGPLLGAARLATTAQRGWMNSPQIDIGSVVTRGELLFEIATPERDQDIVEKATLVRQREAELEAARIALATFDAAIQAGKAHVVQAKAEVRKFESEHSFRTREFNRLKEIVKSRIITPEVVDEKEHQVNAALAAWESSQARVQTAQAELAVVSSKFATAQADIKVKETLIQVAKNELDLAYLLADYSRVYAPFDGMITHRSVDVGDFIQNATSGQSRRLMTITAMNKVKVILQVPDHDAPWVKVGTEATFAVTSEKVRHGFISRMAYALDTQTRTMQAEIDLDNRDRQLLPGMYGKGFLVLQKIPNAQAIPATAVYSRNGKNFILQVENGIAHRHLVRIRYDDGKEMEVSKVIGDKEIALDGSEELIVSNKGEIAEGQCVKTSLLTSLLTQPAADGKTKDTNHDKKAQGLLGALPSLVAWFPGRPSLCGRMPSYFAITSGNLSAAAGPGMSSFLES